MTSPAMVSWDSSTPFIWGNVSVRYLTDVSKFVGLNDNMIGCRHQPHASQEERFYNIASFFVPCVEPGDVVALEGYAFGAKGLVFHIGECTGVLKQALWAASVEVNVIQPTALKKHATGKGNSNKEAMNEAFIKLTGFDVRARLECAPKQWNPSSDIVDAFFLCDYGRTLVKSD